MNDKDAATLKALAELGLRDDTELSPEQEDMLRKAMNPEEQFLDDALRLLTPKDKNTLEPSK